MFLIH